MDEKGSVLKIVALFLQYPGQELLDDLKELDEAMSRVSDEIAQQECRKFMAHVRSTPMQRLQAEYTATFDLAPETCLNLSYHKFGEGKQRGPALLVFREAYKSMGCEPAGSELPDYLPMVLEFLSLCSHETRSAIMAGYSGEIENLSIRLHERKSPYAGLFKILASLFPNCA